MEPGRGRLVAALCAHVAHSLEPAEAQVAAEFVRFAEAHPDCLWRSCVPGHFTGSAWVVDAARRHTLLTHHRKLDKWLQLGGHADGDPDLLAVARREAREESASRGWRPWAREFSTSTGIGFPNAKGSRPTGTMMCGSCLRPTWRSR